MSLPRVFIELRVTWKSHLISLNPRLNIGFSIYFIRLSIENYEWRGFLYFLKKGEKKHYLKRFLIEILTS